jgi:sulfite exporter TauE/SafE
MLPVVVGGAATGGGRRRAVVVTAALGVSVIVFTLLLKATTALLAIPAVVWSALSGGVLVGLGLVMVFPTWWARIAMHSRLSGSSADALAAAGRREGIAGDVLTGAALGPVFSSCSPLYAYVVVTVLPASFGRGLALLGAYTLGLSATLLLVALAGRGLIRRLGWATDQDGWLRRGLGVVFVVVGLLVMVGLDRDLQTWILVHSPVAPWELDSGFVPRG